MAPTLLLAVSFFLCLGLGGDALQCHYCYINSPSEKCSNSVTCDIADGFCLSTYRYEGGKLMAINKSCAARIFKKCNTRLTSRKDGHVIEHHCCNCSDFCNSK